MHGEGKWQQGAARYHSCSGRRSSCALIHRLKTQKRILALLLTMCACRRAGSGDLSLNFTLLPQHLADLGTG